MNRTVARRWPPRAVVLLYHRIGEPAIDPHGLAVSPATFERHLHLLRRRCHVSALEDLVVQLPDRAYCDRTVAITFDDGYADNLEVAYPIAARLNIPITVFVTVEPMLEGKLFWWDELAEHLLGSRGVPEIYRQCHPQLKRMPSGERRRALASICSSISPAPGSTGRGRPLTFAELQAFARLPRVTIGAHSMTHPMLAMLPSADQLWEMAASKTLLEDALSRRVELLAYPFGKPADVSPETCLLAERAGYRAAFTTTGERIMPSSPLFGLSRLSVREWPEEELARRLDECFGEAPASPG